MDTQYFGVPFASSGDRVAVPVTTQTDGSVSYQQGYGQDYSLDPGQCIFTATISGSVMTVDAVGTGVLLVNSVIAGSGVTLGTKINSFGSGSGGPGTYNISPSQTVSTVTLMTGTANPQALLIERTKNNQLYYDITSSLARIQQFGYPQWITAADNQGTSYGYSNGAVVRYGDGTGGTDGLTYQSIVANNTATPGTDPTKWILYLSNLATVAALNAEIARATTAEATKAPINNATMTGYTRGMTAAPGDSSQQFATTQFTTAAVAAEAATRSAADAQLQTNINAEATTRASADTALQTQVTNEVNARAAADAQLQTNINAEATTRASADTTLQGNINAEATTRASADTTLQGNINAEASARASADTALGTRITNETNRAQAAEALLAPTDSPNFTGSGTTTTPGAANNSTRLTNTQWTNAAIAVETNRAQAAEALLAPIHNATFTGSTQGVTASAGDDSPQFATTRYSDRGVAVETNRAQGVEATLAPINAPSLTGASRTLADPPQNDSSTRLPNTRWFWNNSVFTDSFEKKNIGLSAGTVYGPYNHGLSAKPTQATLWLDCINDDSGYSAGDAVLAPTSGVNNSNTPTGYAVRVNASNVWVIATPDCARLPNPANASNVTINLANWALRVELAL